MSSDLQLATPSLVEAPRTFCRYRRYGRVGRVVFGASFVAFASFASRARADVAACVAAHSAGQSERNAGHLLSAKREFVKCAAPSCPSEIQIDCATFIDETEADMPSVVFAALGADGRDTPQVTITMDGGPIVEKLSGRALAVDPGTHVVVCKWPDGVEVNQEVVITQGEKNRRLELRRPTEQVAPQPPPLPAAAKPRRSPPVLSYVLGGLGAVALGSFTAFALSGKSAESEVDRCKPYCSQSTADKMRRRYLFADISLGVAVLSLGSGGYLYFSVKREPDTEQRAAFRSKEIGLRGSF